MDDERHRHRLTEAEQRARDLLAELRGLATEQLREELETDWAGWPDLEEPPPEGAEGTRMHLTKTSNREARARSRKALREARDLAQQIRDGDRRAEALVGVLVEAARQQLDLDHDEPDDLLAGVW